MDNVVSRNGDVAPIAFISKITQSVFFAFPEFKVCAGSLRQVAASILRVSGVVNGERATIFAGDRDCVAGRIVSERRFRACGDSLVGTRVGDGFSCGERDGAACERGGLAVTLCRDCKSCRADKFLGVDGESAARRRCRGDVRVKICRDGCRRVFELDGSNFACRIAFAFERVSCGG